VDNVKEFMRKTLPRLILKNEADFLRECRLRMLAPHPSWQAQRTLAKASSRPLRLADAARELHQFYSSSANP
jgi:hypothetical protein